MYDTEELKNAAKSLDSWMVTSRRGHCEIDMNGNLVFIQDSGDPYTFGQVATIQTLPVSGQATRNLGSFHYIGNDRWIPVASSPASLQAMTNRVMGLSW